jgi:hypothetical protein
MYFIVLLYYNIYKSIHDVEVFGIYKTIEATNKALENYNKNFNFVSFLLNKNLIKNEGIELYETYSSESHVFDIKIDEGYKYEFKIIDYKHIREKEYSFIKNFE